eukprot:2901585-Rhodomonas_salina.2
MLLQGFGAFQSLLRDVTLPSATLAGTIPSLLRPGRTAVCYTMSSTALRMLVLLRRAQYCPGLCPRTWHHVQH